MSQQINRTMSFGEWCLLIGLSIIWGLAFFFAKVAVADIQPLTLVLGRVGLAALVLLVIVKLAGLQIPKDVKT